MPGEDGADDSLKSLLARTISDAERYLDELPAGAEAEVRRQHGIWR